MKVVKRLLTGLVALILIAVAGFVVWAETPRGPAPEALSALESDSQVTVTQSRVIAFAPVGREPVTGFIFYPGGRIDARAYAAPLHQIAARGYLVLLVPMTLNLAFFSADKATEVIAAYPDIRYWAIGGHSLGGVAAALYAAKHDDVQGLVFWASYPADDSLKTSSIKIISMYGTNDLAGLDTLEAKRALLPDDTKYVVIQGGNHEQFGDYGHQPGDHPPGISRRDQQGQVVDATALFLQSLSQ